jgi:hypothetical protein
VNRKIKSPTFVPQFLDEKWNENNPVGAPGLCLSVRICHSGVLKRTARTNLPRITSCRMWHLVLASVMQYPPTGG